MSVPNPTLDRRSLLRNGGIVLSMGAIIAACGENRSGSTDPGRLGVADSAEPTEAGVVNDAVLLRTAQSLEYTALEVYAAAAGLGVLSNGEATLVGRFVADHERHAADLGALVSQAGGEQFTCANPFLMDRVVGPMLEAVTTSEDVDNGEDGPDPDADVHRDVLNIAYAFEALAGASYQALVGELSDPSLRTAAMVIGGEEQRHAAALASAINPDELISPVLLGELVEGNESGIPVPFAIPSVFGQLTGIELTVGARDAEGSRFSTQLQTPAANTMVFEGETC